MWKIYNFYPLYKLTGAGTSSTPTLLQPSNSGVTRNKARDGPPFQFPRRMEANDSSAKSMVVGEEHKFHVHMPTVKETFKGGDLKAKPF